MLGELMTRARSIVRIEARPLDLELTEPFAISSGAQDLARNLLVEVELDDGTIGLGEAAPFPAVSGETQQGALSAIEAVRSELLGFDAVRTRFIAEICERRMPDDPSARCGVEEAVFDALATHFDVPLWELFGGEGGELVTDMTITTGSVEHARSSARAIAARGISTLKIKIGAAKIETDVERIRAAAEAAPGAAILLDANGAFDAHTALRLLEQVREHGVHVALFEQPVRADDLDGMAEVTRLADTVVCADESARSPRDVLAIVERRAATAINVKLMKSGVVRALDMVAIARSAGLDLMIGGMVESLLSMTFSAHFAHGLGGFAFADLDTPLFVKSSPFDGGFTLDRGNVVLDGIAKGTGVSLRR
jgi:L-Ala-D/L-Glu epimerase / N-acetyl-D-glutamate racemase